MIPHISIQAVLIVAAVIAFFLIVMALNHVDILSHWQHTFDDFQIPPQDFYEAVEASIQKREVPNVKFSRLTHNESHILSARREYMRIVNGEFVFDICAAHFGTGSYASWWFGEKPGLFKRLFRKWHLTADMMDLKTYYETDTHKMYKDFIHTSVMEAIDALTNKHGARALAASERIPTDTAVK